MRFIPVTFVSLLSVVFWLNPVDGQSPDQRPIQSQLGSDSASLLAFEFLGAPIDKENVGKAAASAPLSVFTDSSLSFTRGVIGRPTWSIVVHDVPLVWSGPDGPGAPSSEKHAKRDFEVFVDAESGTIIKAISRMPELIADQTAELWDSLNRESSSYSFQSVSLARHIPEGGLARALTERVRINPLDAIEIEASLITMKWTGSGKRTLTAPDDTTPVWWVSLKYIDYETQQGEEGSYLEVRGAMQRYQIIDFFSDDPRLIVECGVGSMSM